MRASFYLAWQYLRFNKGRTAILVACVTLIAVLPLALELVLAESQRQLLARADRTPLVIGARGSALDLVVSTLYFSDETPEDIPMSTVDAVADSGLADPIPMRVRFTARGFPIVGTELDYLDFRDLTIARGEPFGLLGECVLGAAVAEELGVAPGDALVSSPQNLFDLAGVYPLKMRVAGILAATGTADDRAVLVDIRTSWIIEGLAHGHQDLADTQDASIVLDRSTDSVTANAKLTHYNEVTADNVAGFHFHGDPGEHPLTAVIAVPRDPRAGTILQGRYLDPGQPLQIVRPAEVIDTLLATIFRIGRVLNAAIGLVGVATVLALALVFALSLRLRQRELATNFRIGCSRATTVRLLAAEIVLIAGLSALLVAAVLAVVAHYDHLFVRYLLT